MTIPEPQLETWSHQGSVTQSSNTYRMIRNALFASSAWYADKSYEVFLHGSYGNDTNVYAEGDVDAVIRLDSIFGYDVSALPPGQHNAFRRVFAGSAGYTFAEFKQGVITRLSAAFGANNVWPGNKSIKVRANGSRRSTDVVACYQYRRYVRFFGPNDYGFVPGVIFPSASSGQIINYPELHSHYCITKHQATSGLFKPMVRIVKNMRNRLVDGAIIAKDTAPSYYIEGLLYSVPNDKFGGSYADTLYRCLCWLRQADRTKLTCANEQYWLLGSSNVQWSVPQCDLFVEALVALWNEW